MADKHDFSDQAVDAAKQLAPWSTRIPWWVVLIEGIVLAGIGLLAAFNPQEANVTLALIFSAGLVLAGVLQLWNMWRNPLPTKADTSVAARSGIAIYAGTMLLILYFLPDDPTTGEQVLTRIAGFGAFGVAALIYGLLALVQVFRTGGSSRRQALIEFLIFTSVGIVTLWALYSGGDAVLTAVTIIGWIFVVGGIALIALAIWRQQKGDEADEMIEQVTGTVGDAADSVSSIGRSQEEDAPTLDEVADAVDKKKKDDGGESSEQVQG